MDEGSRETDVQTRARVLMVFPSPCSVRNYKGSWNEWCERRDASAHEKGETGT